MAKYKSPSYLKSKVVRINLGDYALLAEISRRAGVTFAEALHLAITQEAVRARIVMPRTQIPMPLTTAYQTRPQTAIATNGNKGVAFRIKPKGARYD